MLNSTVEMLVHIDMLTWAYPRQRAGCDVTDCIAASLTRSQTGGGKVSQHRRRMLERHIMNLDILTRGDMNHIMANILFQNVSNDR